MNPMVTDEDFFITVKRRTWYSRLLDLRPRRRAGVREDIEYFRQKLFAALKIPKQFQGHD